MGPAHHLEVGPLLMSLKRSSGKPDSEPQRPGWEFTCRSYAKGMKPGVSIPDEIFQGAERLARRTRKSRSQLFSDAVREYVARHAPESHRHDESCLRRSAESQR